MKKKYDLRPIMKVQCGDLKWEGKASSIDAALIAAFAKDLPENPSTLLRVFASGVWQYIDFIAALKLAGYTVKKTHWGFKII